MKMVEAAALNCLQHGSKTLSVLMNGLHKIAISSTATCKSFGIFDYSFSKAWLLGIIFQNFHKVYQKTKFSKILDCS